MTLQSRRESKILCELNGLLLRYHLPQIEQIQEASPGLLVALYECLKQTRLPIKNRKDKTWVAKLQKLQTLVDAMAKDMNSLNPDSIDINLVIEGSLPQSLAFLELFTAIARVLVVSQSLRSAKPDQTSASTISAASYAHSNTSCTSSEEMQRTAASSIDSAVEDGAGPLSYAKQTRLETPKAVVRLRQFVQSKKEVQSRQLAALRFKRQSSEKTTPEEASLQPNHLCCSQGKEYRSQKMCLKHDELGHGSINVSPSFDHTPIHIHDRPEIQQEFSRSPKSCLTDDLASHPTLIRNSHPSPVRRTIIIDSPYTRYLKARRNLVLSGLHHNLSPVQKSPRILVGSRNGVADQTRAKYSYSPAAAAAAAGCERILPMAPMNPFKQMAGSQGDWHPHRPLNFVNQRPRKEKLSPWDRNGSEALDSIAFPSTSDQSFYES